MSYTKKLKSLLKRLLKKEGKPANTSYTYCLEIPDDITHLVCSSDGIPIGCRSYQEANRYMKDKDAISIIKVTTKELPNQRWLVNNSPMNVIDIIKKLPNASALKVNPVLYNRGYCLVVAHPDILIVEESVKIIERMYSRVITSNGEDGAINLLNLSM